MHVKMHIYIVDLCQLMLLYLFAEQHGSLCWHFASRPWRGTLPAPLIAQVKLFCKDTGCSQQLAATDAAGQQSCLKACLPNQLNKAALDEGVLV